MGNDVKKLSPKEVSSMMSPLLRAPLDWGSGHLTGTPERVRRSYMELLSGYEMDPDRIAEAGAFEDSADQMVVEANIEFFSLCEHHLLPMYGQVHIGYIPNGRILGLSKFSRIVNAFSRRLQLQERLGEQIALCLDEALAPKGIGVVINARHLCKMMRGIKNQRSHTSTSVMLGAFREQQPVRDEFLRLLKEDRL